MENMTNNLWWPGCGYVNSTSDFDGGCGATCFDKGFMEKMSSFNKKHPGFQVTYPSRAGTGHGGNDIETIGLTGWWLPADRGDARIVLQHGFKSNSNMERTMLYAYLLRSMGFSVLVNNLRDHCYSENSTAHVYEWGHAYPMDLLGAWDYAVNDPDGLLGGKLPPQKVGLQGFSLGGFLTNIAFGLEAKVPAAWVEAPPFVPQTVFSHGLSKTLSGMGLGFLSSLLASPVWGSVQKAALAKGVDLEYHLPEKALPRGPDSKRPIFWAHNKLDDTVPFSEGQKLIELLKSYPEKYEVKGSFVSDALCNGENHCMDMLRDPDGYSAKMCDFWTGVFGIESSACGLDKEGPAISSV
ncbi:unnamed protein product [Polarella glacialis]|uniref:Peptidase S9 prolyl oligopeptidase catalytic domain-containing protein n=1 Tax=Polarella glacialis TaxID=89957 RepID=A0A813GMP7_POLGL|nr:unnamed protein product [Polarella glacialis]